MKRISILTFMITPAIMMPTGIMLMLLIIIAVMSIRASDSPELNPLIPLHKFTSAGAACQNSALVLPTLETARS